MLDTSAPARLAAAPMPLGIAADLQDNLLTATHDLERLQALLAHACDALMGGFHGASLSLRTYTDGVEASASGPGPGPGPGLALLGSASQHLGVAITALQFQDMASQLIAHTSRRLRSCADRLAFETMGGDDGDGDGDYDGSAVVEEAPLRPNPVTQYEMDAGSVELF